MKLTHFFSGNVQYFWAENCMPPKKGSKEEHSEDDSDIIMFEEMSNKEIEDVEEEIEDENEMENETEEEMDDEIENVWLWLPGIGSSGISCIRTIKHLERKEKQKQIPLKGYCTTCFSFAFFICLAHLSKKKIDSNVSRPSLDFIEQVCSKLRFMFTKLLS